MPRLVVAVAVAVLAAALSAAAFAHGGGGHGGGGHGGGGHGGGGHGGGGHGGGGHGGGGYGGGGHFGGGHAHFGGGHGFGHAHFAGGHRWGGHFATSHAVSHGSRNFGQIRTAAVHSGNVHNALASLSHGNASRTARILSNPMARAQIAAGAAVAGWHNGAHGWWRHGHGGFGWVGPLFWPFAYYDIYDYTIWGDGIGFWDYGYPDIYAGIFGPYGYGQLSGYMEPRPSGRRHRGAAPLAELCGDDSRDVAGLPIEQIREAIEPNEAQRAALDDLDGASIKAAQTIRASCPTQIAATAPGRLAAMQQRIDAMISAVALVHPPLERLFGLLDDEQKARFNALAENERKKVPSGGSLAECGAAQPATLAWPVDEIEARLHPTDTQRAALKALQDTTARAAETLKAACQPADTLTPTARLDAVGKRLDIMLQAVKSVRTALEDFFATLNDEQKAQFEAIGQRRTS